MIMFTTYRMSLRHVWVWWGGRVWRRLTSPGGRGTSPGSPSSSSSSSSSPPSSSSSSSALAVSMLPDPKSHLTEVKLEIEVFLQTNKQTNNDAKYVFLQALLKDARPFFIIPNYHFLRVFIVSTCLWPAYVFELKDGRCLFIQFPEGKCQINAKSISLSFSLAASVSIQHTAHTIYNWIYIRK